MTPMKKVKIVAMSNPISIGEMVLESIKNVEAREISVAPAEVQTALPAEPQQVAETVWLNGNLVSENGRYFPQLILQTNAGKPMLEAAVDKLRIAGFSENTWDVVREEARFCLRNRTPFSSAWQGYAKLSGFVWEACHRTGLQYSCL